MSEIDRRRRRARKDRELGRQVERMLQQRDETTVPKAGNGADRARRRVSFQQDAEVIIIPNPDCSDDGSGLPAEPSQAMVPFGRAHPRSRQDTGDFEDSMANSNRDGTHMTPSFQSWPRSSPSSSEPPPPAQEMEMTDGMLITGGSGIGTLNWSKTENHYHHPQPDRGPPSRPSTSSITKRVCPLVLSTLFWGPLQLARLVLTATCSFRATRTLVASAAIIVAASFCVLCCLEAATSGLAAVRNFADRLSSLAGYYFCAVYEQFGSSAACTTRISSWTARPATAAGGAHHVPAGGGSAFKVTPVIPHVDEVATVVAWVWEAGRAVSVRMQSLPQLDGLESSLALIRGAQSSTNAEWEALLRAELRELKAVLARLRRHGELGGRGVWWWDWAPNWACNVPLPRAVTPGCSRRERVAATLAEAGRLVGGVTARREQFLDEHDIMSTSGSVRDSVCQLSIGMREVNEYMQGQLRGGDGSDDHEIEQAQTLVGDQQRGLALSCLISEDAVSGMSSTRAAMEDDSHALSNLGTALGETANDLAYGQSTAVDASQCGIRLVEDCLARLQAWKRV